MCNNDSVSFKARVSRPYERFRENIFSLPRPISKEDLSPEMVADYEYLKKMGIPCSNPNCNHDRCLVLRGIFEEIGIN